MEEEEQQENIQNAAKDMAKSQIKKSIFKALAPYAFPVVLVVIIILLLVGLIIAFSMGGKFGSGNYTAPADVVEYCSTNYGHPSTSQAKSFYGNTETESRNNQVKIDFFGRKVLFHEKAAPCLEAAVKEIEAKGIMNSYSIRSVGTWDWRTKAGGSSLSLHSFGIAFDINEDKNPFCGVRNGMHVVIDGRWPSSICNGPISEPITDIPKEFIKTFKKYGFGWGGEWSSPKDYMHFQWEGHPL